MKDKQEWRDHSYQVPLDFVFLLEICSVILGLIAISMAFMQGQYFILIILVPYTLAYAFIAYLTLIQSQPRGTAAHAD